MIEYCDACGGTVAAIWTTDLGLSFCNHHCVKFEEKLLSDGVAIYPVQPVLSEDKV